MKLEAVILAAGKGARMYSDAPKVLHPLAGRALLERVIICTHTLAPAAIHVVYGFGGEQVPRALAHLEKINCGINWVLQAKQQGTGHAVQQALPHIDATSVVLVLYGDVPLIQSQTLQKLIDLAAPGMLALLTTELPDPSGYGHIVRDSRGDVIRIVEHKDATPAQRALCEINTGILAVSARLLQKWLEYLKNDNAQGEYYLTDIVAMAVADGVKVMTAQPQANWEIMGVNNKMQLAELERVAQRNSARALLERGVTLYDPERIDIRGTLTTGRDVVIDVNVVFEGDVILGDRVYIGPHSVIRASQIGNDVMIKSHCVVDEAEIGERCIIGPFARVRPQTRLGAGAHIGNFVEIKKSEVGAGSKINHLSYVGDSHIGRDVNIGAGVITCNYDGVNKYRTTIGDGAFIGSDCQLIAPVEVGAGATIGAGSTITLNAPPEALTVGRAKQKTITGWKRPIKKSK